MQQFTRGELEKRLWIFLCSKGLLPSLKKKNESRACFSCIRARKATGNAHIITAGHVISDRKQWHNWLVSAGGPHGLVLCAQEQQCWYYIVCSQTGLLKNRTEMDTSLSVSMLLPL